jgi:hypothetical protein
MKVLAVAAVVMIAISAGAANGCPANVLDFAPTPWSNDGPVASVCSSFVADGAAHTAVAYSNGGGGRLAVLWVGSDGVSRVANSDEPLFDVARSIEVADVLGDGRPALIVEFGNRADTLWWLFEFKNGELRLLSPTEEEGGPIVNGDRIDLDGDGRSEIIGKTVVKERDDEGLTVAYASFDVFRAMDGKLVRDHVAEVSFYRRYVRESGTPKREADVLEGADGGTFEVVLLNGTDGSPRCAAGEVKVGGKAVFGEREFKRTVYRQAEQVTAGPGAAVEVVLRGEPKCEIALLATRVEQRNP